MVDNTDSSAIDDAIRTGYPYPLAATYHRAFFTSLDRDEAHEFLLDLFEVTLKYLAAIALSQYLRDGVSDPKINRDLLALQRPSLGHWQGWLRDILALYRRGNTPRPLLVPELGALYEKKQQGEILAAYRTLRDTMTARMAYAGGTAAPAVTTQQFFELLGDYRNRLAHGARPGRYDREQVAGILMPALRELFGQLGFLADYRLIYINSVTVERDRDNPAQLLFLHQLTLLSGDRPRVSQRLYALPQNPANARELYLLDKNAEFKPLLSLHPFLIFRHCESCSAEQAFVLNTSREKTLDYISYQCTHHFNPTEYLGYMNSLLDRIKSDTAPLTETQVEAPAPAPPAPPPAIAPEVEPAPPVAQPATLAPVTPEPAAVTVTEPPPAPPPQPQPVAVEETPSAPIAKPARQAPAARPAWLIPALVVALVLVVGAIAVFAFLTPKEAQPITASHFQLKQVHNFVASTEGTFAIAFVDGGTGLLTANGDGNVVYWDTTTTNAVRSIHAHNGKITSLAVDYNTNYWATSSDDGTLGLWDGDGKAVRQLPSPNLELFTTTAFVPGKSILAAIGPSRDLLMWQVPSGEPVDPPLSTRSFALAISPDDAVAVGLQDNLWVKALDGSSEVHLPFHSSAYASKLAYSSSDSALAAGFQDGTIEVWTSPTEGSIYHIQAHQGAITALEFSPDGSVLASASADGSLRLWKAADGSGLDAPYIGTVPLTALTFSSDGLQLAAAGSDGKVFIWAPQ